MSICRYRGIEGGDGALVAVGVSEPGPIGDAVAGITAQPPDGCVDTGDPTTAEPTGFLLLQRTPAKPTPDDMASNPLAVVELGGCRRVVDPTHGTIGYLNASAVDRLAALADHPVG